jgi:hypothetical protein
MAQSSVITFVSNAGRWYTLPFSCMQVLEKGKTYLLAVEQLSANNITLGAFYHNFRKGASVFDTAASWRPLESMGKELSFAIRGHFGKYDIPQFVLPSATCINSAPIALSSSSHPGGTFYGMGVSGNQFNPAMAGYGLHTVYYSRSSSQGCLDTNGKSILVDSIPVVSLAQPNPVCDNVNGVLLTGGIPSGGYYFGNGIAANRFNAGSLSPGTYTVNYTYANSSGCRDTAVASIDILPLPSVSFAALNPVCLDAPAFALNQGAPFGGSYFGLGISSDSIFTASVSGVGNRNIGYTYADSNSCRDTAFSSITVNPLPIVNLGADTSICGKQTLTLNAGNAGATFQWNTGETTSTISVNKAGTFSVQVTDGNGCSSADSISVDYSSVCTGISDLLTSGGVAVYPNPTRGILQINTHGTLQISTLELMNLQGMVLQTWQTGDAPMITLDLSRYPSGVYMLRIASSAGDGMQRINIAR